jgi:hypothetical protein
VYLSYFGAGNPTHYGIRAIRLPGFIDLDAPQRGIRFMLDGGVYCISATMLQTVPKGPSGPWTEGQEGAYQTALANVMRLLQTGPDNVQAVLRGPDGPAWTKELLRFDQLRFKRLAVYLRHLKEPDDQVGYSILIYRLTDDDVEKILLGPSVDIQADDPSLFEEP